MYKLETVLFQNGERFPLLVNKETGIPDFYSTLWVTVELRYHCAVNTIRNKLGVIQWLMDWEQNNKLIISEMLQKEIVPTESELETLIRHMKLNAVKQKKTNCTKRKIIKKVQTQFIRMRRKTSPFTAEISGEDCEAVLKTFNFSQAYFAAQYIAE